MGQRIYFGLSFDDGAQPQPDLPRVGRSCVGPRQFVQLLESHCNLSHPHRDLEHLRTEQWRQLLRADLAAFPTAFYAAAFAADELATAADMLSRRDELLGAGWDFDDSGLRSERLLTLARLEQRCRTRPPTERPHPGLADRIEALIAAVAHTTLPFEHLYHHEPLALLPPGFRRLIAALAQNGVPAAPLPPPAEPGGNTDLANWQRYLLDPAGQPAPRLRGDGSLLLLRARRDSHVAAYLAALLRRNPSWHPVCLVPDKQRTLDNALAMEGLPSMGTPSASLARPSLQVLKLVTSFLWEPIDPVRIMEFVSLSVKPLDDRLAQRIASFLARVPGLYSDGWRSMITRFFNEELPARQQRDPSIDPAAVRRQFDFWFRRTRYDVQEQVPKDAVREIYAYLQRWARDLYEEEGGTNPTLLVLAEQARRIVDLLDAQPELRLDFLAVERLVRTVYEPAPIEFTPAEVGSLPPAYQPAALYADIPELVWWNFVEAEPNYFFSRWYPDERAELADRGHQLEGPDTQNARLLWQRHRPVLHCRQRLLLCLPLMVNGSELPPHPLLGDLEACFGDISPITLRIDRQEQTPAFAEFFQLPTWETVPVQGLPRPEPFVAFSRPEFLAAREEETPSSLQDLLYYPYQWAFRHKINLRKSSVLSLVRNARLLGNLAHTFLERLLSERRTDWTRAAVDAWIDDQHEDILRKEGAPLLQYGREPDRVEFLQQVRFAAWSLLNYLQRNDWRVSGAEMDMIGQVLDTPVRGRADLVLERGDERAIVDLKYRGFSHYLNRVKNGEDLQLILYADFLRNGRPQWPHVAYFVMSRAEFIARNEAAFQGIHAVAPDADHSTECQAILERIRATYQWRRTQLAAGQLEIRCAKTAEELEDQYGDPGEILEMKVEDAPFDDYRTLIGLVE
jgi:RecB family exonuclease